MPKIIQPRGREVFEFVCGQCQEELRRAKFIIVMDVFDQCFAWMDEEEVTKCSVCGTEQDFPVIFNNEEEAKNKLLEIENDSISKGTFISLPTTFLFAPPS